MRSDMELMCIGCYSLFVREDRLNSEGLCWHCVGLIGETDAA